MPGFACDAASGRCTPGVSGVVCRYKHNCGFGHSCFFDMKYRGKCIDFHQGSHSFHDHARRGVCRLCLEGSSSCRRDMHCPGPLQCILNYKGVEKGSCECRADLPSHPQPKSFGKCETDFNCQKSTRLLDSEERIQLDCVRGVCLPRDLGKICASFCGTYMSCHRGKCVPARAGVACYSRRDFNLNDSCEPGTQCNAPRPPADGPGRAGTCVVGKEGMGSRDWRECENGLLCGSSKYCVKSVEGQRCQSDYWCPEGYLCSKKTWECTASIVGQVDRFRPVARAMKCISSTDYYTTEACINGVCLPFNLGEVYEIFNSSRPKGRSVFCEDGVLVEANP